MCQLNNRLSHSLYACACGACGCRSGASQPHPNIVQHHYVWENDGFLYTAMDHCIGGSLDQYRSALPTDTLWSILTDVLLVRASQRRRASHLTHETHQSLSLSLSCVL